MTTPFNDVEMSLNDARKSLTATSNQASLELESQREEYKKEIDKQKRLISSLTNELAGQFNLRNLF